MRRWERTLDIRAGAAAQPKATVTAETMGWSAVLFEGVPLAQVERDGKVRVAGDWDAVLRIVRLYATSASTNSTGLSPA